MNVTGIKLSSNTHVDRSFDGAIDLRHLLTVYHSEWHGIKAASRHLPGHRAEVSAYAYIDPGDIVRHIEAGGIETVVLQGFSENFDRIARAIAGRFGSNKVRVCAVTHISPVQFVNNPFEPRMLSLIRACIEEGVIANAFSVKPGFSAVFPMTADHLLVNGYPDAGNGESERPRLNAAVVPSNFDWRKNAYPNHLAMMASGVETVFSTLEANALEACFAQNKIHYLGFVEEATLRRCMARCRISSYVTLIECQPMVALESTSVGTPCLTGPLHLPFLPDHPLRKLTEIHRVDDVAGIANRADQVLEVPRAEMAKMCTDYLARVNALSLESYRELIRLVWKN